MKEHYQDLDELFAHEIFEGPLAFQTILVALRENKTNCFGIFSDATLADVLDTFKTAAEQYGEDYATGWLVYHASEVTTLNGWSAVEAYHAPEQYADACVVYGSNREMPFLYEPMPIAEQAALQLADQRYPAQEIEAYLHFLHKNGE